MEVNGQAYVDIEGLASLPSSSLSFRGNQVVLTLPAQDVHA